MPDYTVTKEWLLGMMELEGDGFCNAGGIRDKYPEDEVETNAEQHAQKKAFAKFVELSRRKRKLTQLELAEKAKAAPAEIIGIEDGSIVAVDPETVGALARVFRVPKASLMALAGLTPTSDDVLMEDSVRFVACSTLPAPLEKGEEDTLTAFVRTLVDFRPQEKQRKAPTAKGKTRTSKELAAKSRQKK